MSNDRIPTFLSSAGFASTRANTATRQQLYLLLVVTVTTTLTDAARAIFRDC